MGILAAIIAGCSSNNNPVAPPPPPNTAVSVYVDSSGGFWRSQVDASSYTNFMFFSFATKDTTSTGVPKVAANYWDVGFRREIIELNSGTSTNDSGDCMGTDLGAVNFFSVSRADTAGKSWMADNIGYFIDNWYNYNMQTHQLTNNRYVYSMVDASGQHYVKFRIDSLVGAGMPPSMGTIYLSYYYQDTADSRNLSGTILHGTVNASSGPGFFKFSTGQQVTPANPATSTDWDLEFYNYNVIQNDGPNGPGACLAFFAFTTLADSTNLAGFTVQPSDAPMFADAQSSALTNWYDYNSQTHQLPSKNHVYLIRTGGVYHKVKIESYYANIGGVPVSGHYTFVWKQL